jgi:hypothetical protein
MTQRKTEVKMETTGYERRHAEGRKTSRRHGKGERQLEVVYWTIYTKYKEGWGQKR